MPYADEFGPGGDDASATRKRIEEIERKRLDVGSSYLELSMFGTVLFEVGRGYIFVVETVVLVATIGLIPLTRVGLPQGVAVLGIVVGLIVLAVLGVYAQVSLADWVEEHNAALDDEIAEIAREARDQEI